jgi:hypothetical protein
VGSLPIGRGVGARKQSSSVEARIGVVHGDVDRGSRGEHVGDVGRGEGRYGGVDGDGEDGEGGGGVQERGESSISPSNPSSRSSSASHRLLTIV